MLQLGAKMVGHGELTHDAEADTITADIPLRGAKTAMPFRDVHRDIGPDEFETTSFERGEDGAWQPQRVYRWQRSKREER